MKVYIVMQVNMLGGVGILGVYEHEMDALRAANENIMRRVEAFDVIPAGSRSV
jgi:hypothetical protein